MRWALGKGRADRKNSDWEYNILCDSGLFRFSPAAVFGKETDPEGD